MSWWKRLLGRKPPMSLGGQEFRVVCNLYSQDGKREVRVLQFRHSGVYLDERERVEGETFENRHSGRLVGPFRSAKKAENFIVATAWFRGDDA